MASRAKKGAAKVAAKSATAAATSSDISPAARAIALRRQRTMLADNPHIDYVLFSDASQAADHGIQFEDSEAQSLFRVIRDQAFLNADLKSIRCIYEQLLPMAIEAGCAPARVRQQLIDEYDVDPLGEAATAAMGTDITLLESQVRAESKAAVERAAQDELARTLQRLTLQASLAATAAPAVGAPPVNVCAIDGCNTAAHARCSGCASVYYCSSDHQRKDWNAHKKICATRKATAAAAAAASAAV